MLDCRRWEEGRKKWWAACRMVSLLRKLDSILIANRSPPLARLTCHDQVGTGDGNLAYTLRSYFIDTQNGPATEKDEYCQNRTFKP